MCEEDSDDSEAVAKLLEINDSIHRTVERYKLIKKGDVEAASKIPKGTLGTSTGVGKNSSNELSLIDFDPESTGENETAAGAGGANPAPLENDLLGLSIGEQPSGQAGGIALGFGANSGVPGPPLLSSTREQSSNALASHTPPSRQSAGADYTAFSSLTGLDSASKSTSAPVQQPLRKDAHGPPASADPFASLVAAGSRSSSPLNRPAVSKPKAMASSLLDLSEPSTSTPTSAPAQPRTDEQSQNGTVTDDEWNFASSLPENTLPSSHRLEVHSSFIKVEFVSRRPGGQESIQIMVRFSNNTGQAVHGLHFQVAVEKVWALFLSWNPWSLCLFVWPVWVDISLTDGQSYTLQLKPQSGRDLAPHQTNGIEQEVILNDVPNGKGNSVKMRFKVSYSLGQETKEEQGQVPPLGIS
jgi:ADP-ribosylation factor-binding protein GGA